jgi:hypothetical protein
MQIKLHLSWYSEISWFLHLPFPWFFFMSFFTAMCSFKCAFTSEVQVEKQLRRSRGSGTLKTYAGSSSPTHFPVLLSVQWHPQPMTDYLQATKTQFWNGSVHPVAVPHSQAGCGDKRSCRGGWFPAQSLLVLTLTGSWAISGCVPTYKIRCISIPRIITEVT